MSKKSDEDVRLEKQRQEIEEKYQEGLQKKEVLEGRLREDVKGKIGQIGVLSEKDIDEQKQSLQKMSDVFTGMHVKDQQTKKLTRLQRLIKKLGVDKLLSKARSVISLGRPSATPNKKGPGQGQSMG